MLTWAPKANNNETLRDKNPVFHILFIRLESDFIAGAHFAPYIPLFLISFHHLLITNDVTGATGGTIL